MNYFKDEDGNIYSYDDQQVEMGLADGKTPLTQAELDALFPPAAPEPLPIDPSTELANPTVAEWNALCVAAGAPELQK